MEAVQTRPIVTVYMARAQLGHAGACAVCAVEQADRPSAVPVDGPRAGGVAESEQVKNLLLSQAENGLTESQQDQVAALKARDKEVRDHEQAHARVGGPYAGEPSYSYQTGSDGQRYAIGGEVAIDAAPVADDPEATIAKMEVVKAAALAPAEPSSQDRKVAALAETQRMQAIADLAALRAAVTTQAAAPVLDAVA